MREVTTKVYLFDELTDSAKEKARSWYRSCDFFDGLDLLESNIDTFETAADILGFRFETETVQLYGGGTRQKPRIDFAVGTYGGEDGAAFYGQYAYTKGCAKNIRAEFPHDEVLHAIADKLTAVQRRHFYALEAIIRENRYCRGCEARRMVIDVEHVDGIVVCDDTAEEVIEATRDFAGWIYSTLNADYEYQTSDEAIDETIICNEYEFDEDGNRSSL